MTIATDEDQLDEEAPPTVGDTTGAEGSLLQDELKKETAGTGTDQTGTEKGGNGKERESPGTSQTQTGSTFDVEAARARIKATTRPEDMQKADRTPLFTAADIALLTCHESEVPDGKAGRRKNLQSKLSGWVCRKAEDERKAWEAGRAGKAQANVEKAAEFVKPSAPFDMFNLGMGIGAGMFDGASSAAAMFGELLERDDLRGPVKRKLEKIAEALKCMKWDAKEIKAVEPDMEAVFAKHPEWRQWFAGKALSPEIQLAGAVGKVMWPKIGLAYLTITTRGEDEDEDEAAGKCRTPGCAFVPEIGRDFCDECYGGNKPKAVAA